MDETKALGAMRTFFNRKRKSLFLFLLKKVLIAPNALVSSETKALGAMRPFLIERENKDFLFLLKKGLIAPNALVSSKIWHPFGMPNFGRDQGVGRNEANAHVNVHVKC